MALTQMEYEQLYKQIRNDVLGELEQKRLTRSNWAELKDKINVFLSTRCEGSNRYKYQVGFSTLIRLLLNIRRVESIQEEQIPLVNEFLDELFELIDKYKTS